MSTKKIILISLVWLVGPYIAVLLLAFCLGVYDGSFQHNYSSAQLDFVRAAAGISVLVGIVMAVVSAIFNKRKEVKP